MTADKKYITQISHGDMKDLAAATNPRPGEGVNVRRERDGFVFSVDKQQLKLWIWTFLKNGGEAAAATQVTSVNIDGLD